MDYTIMLDLFVIVVLVTTIIFSVRLNKRLEKLYRNREEMEQFFDKVTESLHSSEKRIRQLHTSDEELFQKAQDDLKKAETTRDDLAFLNERGNELAERLDASIRVARELKKTLESIEQSYEQDYAPQNPSAVAAAHAPESSAAPDYDNEPDFIRRLQGVR